MANKILDKVKYIIGIDDLEEDESIEETESVEQVEAPVKKNYGKTNRILNIHTNSQMKLVIYEPQAYEDSPKVVDELKSRKTVVINLESLDNDVKRQIFEFLSGAIYAIEGNIQKVAKDIFIIAPNNVEIDGRIKEELKNRGLFPWQK